ncbi:hypothetical protein Pcatena_12290 [Parolsenella catena]|uniref:Uncharacterized protein n=1 Tax=Parolsenella catena TaxID=2003188 RepID=A0A3G9K6D0_9ACTN|nr:hypothetical protein Pcatena_12290 [Parolsenella catena]
MHNAPVPDARDRPMGTQFARYAADVSRRVGPGEPLADGLPTHAHPTCGLDDEALWANVGDETHATQRVSLALRTPCDETELYGHHYSETPSQVSAALNPSTIVETEFRLGFKTDTSLLTALMNSIGR